MEREKTDHALAERQAAEEDSDLAVRRARESADALLAEVRAKADELLEGSPRVGTRATPAPSGHCGCAGIVRRDATQR